MVARRLLVAAVLVATVLGLAASAAGGSRSSSSVSVYRLRADARLCPSPMCGGFWASRVNRTLTTCLDGTQTPSCYVGTVDLSALPQATQDRVRPSLSTGRALVTGSFERYPGDEFPQLARLVAVRVWLAEGTGRETGIYRVVDNGVRCVRAPCFSFRATFVNGIRTVKLSGLDFTKSGASPATIDAAHAALTHGGVLVAGKIVAAGTARTLVATQVWLSA